MANNEIDLKFYLEKGRDNTVFESMINGGYVLNGKMEMYMTLRLLIIIEVIK